MTDPVYYAPTDVETIKQHIEAHREAARIIFAQLEMLNQRLMDKIGKIAWLQWESELNAREQKHTPDTNGQT